MVVCAARATVLLLHGARFSSLTWTAQLSESMERTGTLETLKSAKIRGVALDLPGIYILHLLRAISKAIIFCDKAMENL